MNVVAMDEWKVQCTSPTVVKCFLVSDSVFQFRFFSSCKSLSQPVGGSPLHLPDTNVPLAEESDPSTAYEEATRHIDGILM
jgi:hypothetical protein